MAEVKTAPALEDGAPNKFNWVRGGDEPVRLRSVGRRLVRVAPSEWAMGGWTDYSFFNCDWCGRWLLPPAVIVEMRYVTPEGERPYSFVCPQCAEVVDSYTRWTEQVLARTTPITVSMYRRWEDD